MLQLVIREYRQAFAGLPKSIWLLAFTLFVNRCGQMVLPFLSLYVTDKLNFSEATAGKMIAVYGVGGLLGAALGGWLAQNYGAARTIVLAYLGAAPCYLLLMFPKTVWQFAACLMLISIATESARPSMSTAATQLVPSGLQTRALALMRLAANLGVSIGPVIGGLLYGINVKLLFILDGVSFAVAGLLVAIFFVRKVRILRQVDPDAPRAKSPWLDVRLLFFLAMFLMVLIIFFQLSSTYTLYLRDHLFMSEAAIGGLFAINTIAIVLFEMVLIRRVERRHPIRLIAIGAVLICVGFGILPFGVGVPICILSILIWTLGEMLTLPLAISYVAQLSHHGNRGSYMGVVTMTFAAASILGPLIGTAIYQHNPQMVWYLCLAVAPFIASGLWLMSLWQGNPAPAEK